MRERWSRGEQKNKKKDENTKIKNKDRQTRQTKQQSQKTCCSHTQRHFITFILGDSHTVIAGD